MKTRGNIFCVLLVLLLMGGCAASNAPRTLVRSLEVNKIIEGGTILPDHTYYYAGPQDKPDVIIAIDNRYTFQESVHWHKIDLTEQQLQSWNRIIDNYYRMKYPYYGSYIMAPDGNKAGIYYSKYSFTVIKFPAPNQIIIYRPDPSPEQRLYENFGNKL